MLRFKALALLILFSVTTIGNAIDVHYCEGEITDVALFGDIHCCCANIQTKGNECHESLEKKCHSSADAFQTNNSTEKKGCCDTAKIDFTHDNDFAINKSLNIPTAIIFTHFNCYLFQELTQETSDDFHYQSPYFVRDIPIFNQVFRI